MVSFVKNISDEKESCGQLRTARAYVTAFKSYELFLGRQPVFTDIEAGQIKRYEKWLMDKGLAKNTVSFYMRNLRVINNRAVIAKLIEAPADNPFSNVYTGVARTAKRALSEEEMRKR
jgi:hypothetical protein